jgi:glycosyltransferase involved in cell wall biosynthesis
MTWEIVVPALKVSGGTREALRLGGQLSAHGTQVLVLSLWRADDPMPTTLPVELLSNWPAIAARAALQWPWLALRFARRVRSQRFLFTHYSTLPLSLCVPRARRFFFVQDLEWKFIHNGVLSHLVRAMILFFYRRGSLVSANDYLTDSLRELGLPPALQAPIWADADWLTPDTDTPRDIDFVMMLRKGAHKRLHDYHRFIELARGSGRELRLAVISPDAELIAAVRDRVSVSLLRPALGQMRSLYQRTRCFVHLSEHEGFGLPPLEAMAAGCVPLCRDSGGVRAFMAAPELAGLLLPAQTDVAQFFQRACELLEDPAQLRDYSARAREVFRRGSVATARASEAVVRALVSRV